MENFTNRPIGADGGSASAEVPPLDFVTAMRTFGPLATKRITYNTVNYGKAATFSISEHGVSNIHELAALLQRVAGMCGMA
jgi:hypothetical protein